MKTSPNHFFSMKKFAVVFAAVIAAGALLPQAARAEGDSDREEIAAFYASLDQAKSSFAAELTPTPSVQHLGYTMTVRSNRSKKPRSQPKTTVDDTVPQGRAGRSPSIAWFNSNRPGYLKVRPG